VLDGWWREGWNGQNGWAIGQEREYASEAAQDEADALALYATLEDEIIPLFYQRDAQGLPHGWLKVMRAAIASVAPAFSLDRMLKEYVRRYYMRAGMLGARIGQGHFAGARALAEWEARVRAGWPEVALTASGPAEGETSVGGVRGLAKPLRVEATVRLGACAPTPRGDSLCPDDLAVELVYGHPGDGDLQDAVAVPMQLAGSGDGAAEYRYTAVFDPLESGTFAYGVRVRPHHADLPNPFALSLVKWA
jgi:starch phosphorylase